MSNDHRAVGFARHRPAAAPLGEVGSDFVISVAEDDTHQLYRARSSVLLVERHQLGILDWTGQGGPKTFTPILRCRYLRTFAPSLAALRRVYPL